MRQNCGGARQETQITFLEYFIKSRRFETFALIFKKENKTNYSELRGKTHIFHKFSFMKLMNFVPDVSIAK